MSDEANILSTLGKMGAQIDNIENHVKKLSEVVVEGNGQLPLVTRVDRLEVAESQRGGSAKRTWATILSLIGIATAAGVSLGVALLNQGP